VTPLRNVTGRTIFSPRKFLRNASQYLKLRWE
jgi:hypothetical protein